MSDFHLETERLIIRNWCEDDRDLFYLINSDETVMEFFPFRRNREQSDKMLDHLRSSITAKGYGFTAVELKSGGNVVGFCGLEDADVRETGKPDQVEIGWRFAPQFWGKGYATEAAKKLLEFGFEVLELDEILSFAVHNNHRSFAVMERLGMIRDKNRDFDAPSVPDTHPHLKRHHFYTLTKTEYLARMADAT